jgi:hypothetical protein
MRSFQGSVLAMKGKTISGIPQEFSASGAATNFEAFELKCISHALEQTCPTDPEGGKRILPCLQTSSHQVVRKVSGSLFRRLPVQSCSTHSKLHSSGRIDGRRSRFISGRKTSLSDYTAGRAQRMPGDCGNRHDAEKRKNRIDACRSCFSRDRDAMAARNRCQRAGDDLRFSLAQLPLKPTVNQRDISLRGFVA